MGSPPPMRGKVNALLQSVVTFGITPAYAGKRQAKFGRFHRLADHPRLCGEKPALTAAGKAMLGSPPPMRGKEKHSTQPRTQPGITPAYAGKRFLIGKL